MRRFWFFAWFECSQAPHTQSWTRWTVRGTVPCPWSSPFVVLAVSLRRTDKPEGFRISSDGMFGGMDLATPGTFHQIEMVQKDDSEVQFSSGLCGHIYLYSIVHLSCTAFQCSEKWPKAANRWRYFSIAFDEKSNLEEYAAQIANADQMLSVFAEFVPEEERDPSDGTWWNSQTNTATLYALDIDQNCRTGQKARAPAAPRLFQQFHHVSSCFISIHVQIGTDFRRCHVEFFSCTKSCTVPSAEFRRGPCGLGPRGHRGDVGTTPGRWELCWCGTWGAQHCAAVQRVNSWWFYPLKMVISHSYVSLPEGNMI